ncbi:hypothetical protein F4777DRAFT_532343 [Nemania sp. FL0916]|nr:hypothetical protein F4777DRAFT_532343 [Nemania sp. FL0916]
MPHETIKRPRCVSLVRMGEDSACGTATFYTSISVDQLAQRLQDASRNRGHYYKFDSKFHGITPLYEGYGNQADVDFIAITGLAGHAFGSWKSPTSDDMWLRDYIPRDIPKCRTILYGYDTQLLTSQSKQSIGDIGARFMESIIAFRTRTQALLCAHKKFGDTSDLNKACHALLFFGTPHRGLRYPQLSTIVRGQPNKAFIDSLVVDEHSEPSAYLKRISDEFARSFKGYGYVVVNFLELKLTPTLQFENEKLLKTGEPSLLVNEESAIAIGLGAAVEADNISFDADHTGLVKFEHRDCEEYVIVSEKLIRIVSHSKKVVDERFQRGGLIQATSKSTDECLRSLAFQEMDKRYGFINTAYKGTCLWLDGHPEFQKWWSHPRALLWINGKPGSGKSTLLKYALERIQTVLQASENNDLILSFFCHARGAELQKIPLGLYRSLLHQILSKYPGSIPDLFTEFVERQRTRGSVGIDWKWREDELKTYLERSLSAILEVTSVILFVDALDEFGRDNAVRLIDTFETLLDLIPESDYDFRICFSCRHFPNLRRDFEGNGALAINVEHENTADIETYLSGKLRKSSYRDTMIPQLLERSSGVFLWAYLATEQISQLEFDGEQSLCFIKHLLISKTYKLNENVKS